MAPTVTAVDVTVLPPNETAYVELPPEVGVVEVAAILNLIWSPSFRKSAGITIPSAAVIPGDTPKPFLSVGIRE
jgi:hypothetical protein